jgi:O-antigen ligase
MASFDRANLARIADGLMAAVAVSLPWSTSATGILLVLWLLALIPTLAWGDVRRELVTPAGSLPVLLVLFGFIGMAWADVTLLERWKGLDGFIKLLVIPLLMVQFRRSDGGKRVFIGFLAACVALLVASWAVTAWPTLPRGSSDAGVAVKSYIVQSAEFMLCAAGLLYVAIDAIRAGRWAKVAALVIAMCAFLADIFFIATSRTTLVTLPVLLVVFGIYRFGRKGFVGALILVLVITVGVWTSSDYVRHRVDEIFAATERHQNLGNVTPSEERLVFWTKSVRFIEEAPFFGHGTGSITESFRRAAVGQLGSLGEISSNPHNLTFAVAIQLGLAGAIVLWAMWIAHCLVFRGGGLTAWIGLSIVIQNIVGSLFNSFLFDFTEGWLYVIGFGVAAGMVLRQRDVAGADAARQP